MSTVDSGAQKDTSLEDPIDLGVEIAAARLRIVLDRRLGRETPEYVTRLAALEDPRVARRRRSL